MFKNIFNKTRKVNNLLNLVNMVKKENLQNGFKIAAAYWGITEGLTFADLDITVLGIGHHRNWLFHSAAAPYLFKKLYAAYEKYRKKQPSDSNNFFDKLIFSGGKPLIAAFSFGYGIHLLLDGLGTKDVVGFPVGNLLVGGFFLDRIYLLGNSAICFKIGYDISKEYVDIAKVKEIAKNLFNKIKAKEIKLENVVQYETA